MEQGTYSQDCTMVRCKYSNDNFQIWAVELSDGKMASIKGHFFESENMLLGKTLTVRGDLEKHPKFGWQINMTSYDVKMSWDKNTLIEYLGSGEYKGIREGLAKRIVDRFGLDTIAVITAVPERLAEVKGITQSKAKYIGERWKELESSRQTKMLLFHHGITGVTAENIWKKFGTNTLRILQDDPYQLIGAIRGMGFTTADKIAWKFGFDPEKESRIQQGILYTLQKGTISGNVYLTYAQLLKESLELLDVSEHLITNQMNYLSGTKQIIEEQGKYYTNSLYLAETKVAKLLVEISENKTPCLNDSDDVISTVNDIEKDLKVEYGEKQREAISTVLQKSLMILTGGPGTGKTTVMRGIVEACKRLNMPVVLAAPTGKAAQRMIDASGEPASTIHRILCYNAEEGCFDKNYDSQLDNAAYIIDESSMIDIDLMRCLLEAMPTGAKLILIGDVDQLPSIGPGCVFKDIIDSGAFATVKLDFTYRQAQGSQISEWANNINKGYFYNFKNKKDGDFFVINADSESAAETIVRLATQRIPEAYGYNSVRDIQVLTPMHKGNCGTDNLNLLLQKAINAENMKNGNDLFGFYLGDKVMQTKNNYRLEVFNGETGTITRIDETNEELAVDFGDKTVVYDSVSAKALIPAYACTIHKSQGSEYPVVIMPMVPEHTIMHTRSILYTGITRGKKLVVIVGNPSTIQKAAADWRIQPRNSWLCQRIAACTGTDSGSKAQAV